MLYERDGGNILKAIPSTKDDTSTRICDLQNVDTVFEAGISCHKLWLYRWVFVFIKAIMKGKDLYLKQKSKTSVIKYIEIEF